jgi:membrane fusion protein, heavy metal efflux system
MKATNLINRVAATIALLSLAWPTGSARGHDEHEHLPTKGATLYGDLVLLSPSAEKAIGLKRAKITLGPWRQQVVANAAVDVACSRHGFATTLLAGRIERLLVRPGDMVEAGQELARVKSIDLEKLEADLLRASAERDLAARVLDQRETLASQGALAEKELFRARTDFREKSAEVALVSAKLRAVGFTSKMIDDLLTTRRPVRSLKIVSPIGGAISWADVREGQMVEPSEHLFHIVDLAEVMVVADVLESDAWRVRANMPVALYLATFPDRPFAGRLEHVALKIDPVKHTLNVRAHLANPDGLMRQGMFGRLEIEVAAEPEAVLCPAEAVVRRGALHYVFQERGRGHGKYLRQPVRIAGRRGRQVEIAEGLFPGQRVVTLGSLELAALVDQLEAHGEGSKQQAAGSRQLDHAAEAASGRRTIHVPGRIETPTSAKQFATTTAPGRLVSLQVERGDRVRAGQVLAEVDSLDLRNLQLDLLGTRTKLELTRQMLERFQGLGDERLVSRQQVWQLESDESSLESRVESVKEQLAMLGLLDKELERLMSLDVTAEGEAGRLTTLLPVRAPADGIVTDFELGIGEVVGPADKLFELQDMSKVWAQAFVYEQHAADVAIGQSVTVTVAADPSIVARGTIARISPIVNGPDRALSVWAELDNPEFKLKEGMMASIEIDQVDTEGKDEG